MSGLKSLDTIIQAAAVDLFQFYGVAVAPLPRCSMAHQGGFPDTSAQIVFNSPALSGSLSLSIPDELFPLMKGEAAKGYQPRDYVRELTNQLMGRVKSRLIQFQVLLETGLPALVNADLLRRRIEESVTSRVFVFRTLRGDVVVGLDGTFDESQLRYTGRAEHGSEGDIILF